MAKNIEYRCLKCKVYLDITARYAKDKFRGDIIYIEARCPKCRDVRVGSIDDSGEVAAIAGKVGT